VIDGGFVVRAGHPTVAPCCLVASSPRLCVKTVFMVHLPSVCAGGEVIKHKKTKGGGGAGGGGRGAWKRGVEVQGRRKKKKKVIN
jgi:hypothetical protein